MAKPKVMTNSLLGEILSFGLYKSSQGRITRQVTCGTLWVAILLGVWRIYVNLYSAGIWQYAVPLAVLMIGFWVSYRIVHYARFADFLIAVEAEMNKVSWPSRTELVRAAVVVIFVIFSLALVLFGFDFLWRWLFQALHILHS